MNYLYTFCLVIIFIISACSEPQQADRVVEETVESSLAGEGLSNEQLTFWDNIREHCGNAYEGELADATPFYQTFDAEQIRIHIRDCTDNLTHISLHIDDDHSRNLMLTQEEGTLLLKHDHRNEDGTEEEITQYGGFAPKPGLENRQIFRRNPARSVR